MRNEVHQEAPTKANYINWDHFDKFSIIFILISGLWVYSTSLWQHRYLVSAVEIFNDCSLCSRIYYFWSTSLSLLKHRIHVFILTRICLNLRHTIFWWKRDRFLQSLHRTQCMSCSVFIAHLLRTGSLEVRSHRHHSPVSHALCQLQRWLRHHGELLSQSRNLFFSCIHHNSEFPNFLHPTTCATLVLKKIALRFWVWGNNIRSGIMKYSEFLLGVLLQRVGEYLHSPRRVPFLSGVFILLQCPSKINYFLYLWYKYFCMPISTVTDKFSVPL